MEIDTIYACNDAILIQLWLSGVSNNNLYLEKHSQANSNSKKVNSHPRIGTQVNSELGQIIATQCTIYFYMVKDLKIYVVSYLKGLVKYFLCIFGMAAQKSNIH